MDNFFATDMGIPYAAVILGLLISCCFVWLIISRNRRAHEERLMLEILQLFKTSRIEGKKDPQSLVAWAELSVISRRLFPSAFETLDRATQGRFPFSDEFIEDAHARWTSEWLSWELKHDREYKEKAMVVENELKNVSDQEKELLLNRRSKRRSK